MKTSCRVVRSIAPSTDVAGLAKVLSNHVGSCLSCQAELARYGKLRRQLASLAEVTVQAPEPLAAEVAAAVASNGNPAETEAGLAHPVRVAAAAGAVVAAAAGAAAVAAWRHSRIVTS
ncbi:MAG: hypothetical protein GY926_15045 [bacterium]|nr:hypothetical protein [bacterium]MCP4966533.1 hypothetical protein [bacterium]